MYAIGAQFPVDTRNGNKVEPNQPFAEIVQVAGFTHIIGFFQQAAGDFIQQRRWHVAGDAPGERG